MIDFLFSVVADKPEPQKSALLKLIYMHWSEVLPLHTDATVEQLADVASNMQGELYIDAGFASGDVKELMPYAALMAIYDRTGGFDDFDYARRLVEGFEKSHCSVEVKFGMRKAALIFGLADSLSRNAAHPASR